ncbi:MAG TPA: AMP-binding protein, partial [Myxococcota bacterium]
KNAIVDAALDVGGTALASALTGALSLARGLVKDGLPEKLERAVAQTETALRSLVDTDPADRAWATSPPFFGDDVRFSQRNLRVLQARAATPGHARADWKALLLDEHLPALEQRRAARTSAEQLAPREAYDSIPHLLVEAAARRGTRPALSLISGDDVVDISYRELLARAQAAALRLRRAGVAPGDRVIVSGANHPSWSICAFGVMFARAVAVPLDPGLEPDAVARITRKARPRLAVVDKGQRDKWRDVLVEPVLDLHLLAAQASTSDELLEALPDASDTASILFTSGTTGEPKGVELTHGNFTSLLASLQAIFPVGRGDRLLSVLPLHHTFEFSGGLLMPLAAGAHIYTPDALTGERVLYALKTGRITAMVGVPALWQLLERRIQKQASERGDVVKAILDAALAANRALGKKTGLSFGKIALKPIHDELGGHLQTLISGGSALPPSVHQLFQGLGLPLAEGYGLTEAAPVLTVAEGVHGAVAGTVGRPIPGVELKIVDAGDGAAAPGSGEIWARAPNVMKGYFEDPAATTAVLQEGWLRTGDIGKIDDDGRLHILGRSKDVVVTSTGENVYLDDTERRL